MAEPVFWHLLPHATVCVASDKLILLDLRQDRYFHVPEALTDIMLKWLEAAECSPPPTPIARMLERSGIAQPVDPIASNSMRECIAIPRTLTSPTWLKAPGRSANILDIAAIVTRTWVKLRRTPLRSILQDRAATTSFREDTENLVERSTAFDRARAFAPVPRRCLLDSLALSTWLSRSGVPGRLVFGVTARPFSAHCWLQVPGSILNDSYDHVSRFTPILVA